jgi:hypothetical protein
MSGSHERDNTVNLKASNFAKEQLELILYVVSRSSTYELASDESSMCHTMLTPKEDNQ